MIDLFLFGFIFICIWTWLTKLKIETHIIVLWSLFVNVIIKEFCSFIHDAIVPSTYIPEYTKFVIYFFIAVIAPFVLYSVVQLPFFKLILSKTARKTFNDDIFNDVLDLKNGTNMIVYIKNSPYFYVGDFKIRDEHGAESFLGMSNYTIYDRKENEIIREDGSFTNGSLIIFRLQDIESIELVYGENSDTWKLLSTNV